MKKQLCFAAGMLAAAFGSNIAIAADKKVNFRLSFYVPPKHEIAIGLKIWADAIKKASNGSVTITMFPSGQLGSARDHYDMVKRGSVDMAFVTPGYTPGRFPVVGAIDLPFMVSDGMRGAKAMTRFYARYAPKEMSDVKVCHTYSHEPGTFHSVKPIRVPADIKGMKIRTATATTASYVIAMGGAPVQVSIMEAFETLKRGIADGITAPWGTLIRFNFGKVVKNHLDAQLYVTTFLHAINLKKYNSLSEAQRKAIDGTCTPDMIAKIYAPNYNSEMSLIRKLRKDKSRTINKIGPAELALWRKAAEPVFKQWSEAVEKKGYNAETLLNEFKAELKRENALVE